MLAFFMDEDSMNGGVVSGLRRNGIDVVTAHEVGRRRIDDEDQLVFAASQGRVIYSSNVGHFADIHRTWLRGRRHHAGIVLLEWQRTSIGVQIRTLLRIAAIFDAEGMQDRLEYLANWVS